MYRFQVNNRVNFVSKLTITCNILTTDICDKICNISSDGTRFRQILEIVLPVNFFQSNLTYICSLIIKLSCALKHRCNFFFDLVPLVNPTVPPCKPNDFRLECTLMNPWKYFQSFSYTIKYISRKNRRCVLVRLGDMRTSYMVPCRI